VDIFLICVALGMAVTVSTNLRELQEVARTGPQHGYSGPAVYITTSSIAYGIGFWIIALAIIRVLD
jgi:hypothetical protein